MKPLLLVCTLLALTINALECPSRGVFKQNIATNGKLTGLRSSSDSCEAFTIGPNEIYSIDSQQGALKWHFSPQMGSLDSIVPSSNRVPVSSDASALYAMVYQPNAAQCTSSCSDLIAVSRGKAAPELSWSHTVCSKTCSPLDDSSILLMPQSNGADIIVRVAASKIYVLNGATGQTMSETDLSGSFVTGADQLLRLQTADTFSVRVSTSTGTSVQVWQVSQQVQLTKVSEVEDADGFQATNDVSHHSVLVQKSSTGHTMRGVSVSDGSVQWSVDSSVLSGQTCALSAPTGSLVYLVSATSNANQTDTSIAVKALDVATGRITSQSKPVNVKGSLDDDACDLISIDDNNQLIVQYRQMDEFFVFDTQHSLNLVFHGQLMDRNSASVSNLLKLSDNRKACAVLSISDDGWVGGFSVSSYPL